MRPRGTASRLLGVALVTFLTACGGSEPPASADGAGGLLGTYRMTLESSDLRGTDSAVGSWELQIADENGEVALEFTDPLGTTFSPGGVVDVTDVNEPTGTLVIEPDPACPTQEPPPTEGRYTWAAQDGELTIAVVEDSCVDRLVILSTNAWTAA